MWLMDGMSWSVTCFSRRSHKEDANRLDGVSPSAGVTTNNRFAKIMKTLAGKKERLTLDVKARSGALDFANSVI